MWSLFSFVRNKLSLRLIPLNSFKPDEGFMFVETCSLFLSDFIASSAEMTLMLRFLKIFNVCFKKLLIERKRVGFE